jgi:hypothetical protein
VVDPNASGSALQLEMPECGRDANEIFIQDIMYLMLTFLSGSALIRKEITEVRLLFLRRALARNLMEHVQQRLPCEQFVHFAGSRGEILVYIEIVLTITVTWT